MEKGKAMAVTAENRGWGSSPWRIAGWGVLVALLLAPAVAMRFTSEVAWDETDFILMGALLGSVGLGFEFLMRRSGSLAWRAGAGLAIVLAFLTVWVNLAVGMIGTEDNPANLMFAGVLATALAGAILARLRPAGMAWAMVAAATAQALVGAVALGNGLGVGDPNWPMDVIGVTGLFCTMWLMAAGLFALAALRPL